MHPVTRRPAHARVIALLAAVAVAAGLGYLYWRSLPAPPPPVSLASRPVSEEEVRRFCSACHLYPPADTFPREHWKDEVERAYNLFRNSGMPLLAPPLNEVVKHYEARAPERLPDPEYRNESGPPPVRFQKVGFATPSDCQPPAVSHVGVVHLTDPKQPELLVCEMRHNKVLALRPRDPSPVWRVLAELPHPAKAEVVDLDGDGVRDVLVACLGNFLPTDARCGSVVLLRGNRDGSFTKHVLLERVGRVADVQAADFRGTGKLDLVVAAFGWQRTGEVLLLENQTTDPEKPTFTSRELDDRHGSIHVPVVDLNGDGKPDFLALFGQEQEAVVAFLNDGGGRFRKETVFRAEHPGYGSSGVQLTDLNGDGLPDLLYTNGDVLDLPYLLKPYHGVQWLENPGPGRFPWKHHALTPLFGVHRAVAADVTGTGRQDVVAVSFLPASAKEFRVPREERRLDSLLLLHQAAPGQFRRFSLEQVRCDYVSCAAGDLWGSGRNDLVTGTYASEKVENLVEVWRNLGP